MNAAFCCASLGITPTVRHADYLGSWLDVLREDSRAIVRAASLASKAADYLLACLPEEDDVSVSGRRTAA
jgi:antirestriction protein ArdC